MSDFKPGKVYQAIAQVTKALAKEGIAKARKNDHQGYSFRGIDDVYNALAPILADANLCVLPNVLERECLERTNAKGNAIFYVTVKVDFAFVSAEDSSAHHVVTYGEAMDSGDKATNKAMSAAYKYAAMQAFCIPTEGDNDADSTTHEVKAAEPRSYNAKKDAFEAMPADEQMFLRGIAQKVSDLIKEGRAYDAYGYWLAQKLDADEMAAIQYLWTSGERTELKKAAEQWKAVENAPEREKHRQTRTGQHKEAA